MLSIDIVLGCNVQAMSTFRLSFKKSKNIDIWNTFNLDYILEEVDGVFKGGGVNQA